MAPASNSPETSETVVLGSTGVTFSDVIGVARHGSQVVISQEALAAISKTRKYIEEYASGGVAVMGFLPALERWPTAT